jgi:trigger factor
MIPVKVSSQRLPESQVLLEVEVDPEQMERSMDRAYRRLVQRVEVPGFRKGKTPRPMLERHLGRDRLVREALDILIPEAYNQAVETQDIDAIGQPAIELVTDEPLTFKATVPVRPTVELGDYAGTVRVAREPITVDEAEIDRAIEELRRRYALHEPVERPVQTGDIIRADVRIVFDDREVFKDEDAEFTLREGATIMLPGFAEGIVGAEKGVAREITVTAPPGDGPLAGKSGTVTALVRDVKEEKLPELDDEFARQVGDGFESLDALRDRLRSDLRERLEGQAEEAYRHRAVEALVSQASKIEFPPVMVEREIEHLIHDQARATGRDIDGYLQTIRRTAEELREELSPPAAERVRRSLALTQLAEDEKIEVADAEIDAEIERIAGSSGQQADQVRRLFASADARAGVGRSLLTRKTMDRLAEIAGGDGAGPVAAKAGSGGAGGKRTRDKKAKKEAS